MGDVTYLPQANATLLSINGGGASEDYDAVEGADAVKWQGSADAYVKETITGRIEGGVLNKVKDTRLVIPGDLEPPVKLATGNTVTYVYDGVTITRRIFDWDASLLAGVPHPTIRLHLEVGQGG